MLMATRRPLTEYAASPPNSVGGHPALDFINTLHMAGGELTDAWQSDEDVAAWITRQGLSETLPSTTWPVGALLEKARSLREVARKAVEARKGKKTLPLDELNDF